MPHDFHGLSLVGEMPGRQEVRLGACFIGPSGKLLDAALGANSLTRDTIHITNAVRCGLSQGKKPEDDLQRKAGECCRPLLFDNLEALGTKVACAVGAVPWEGMTRLKGIDKYRGTVIHRAKEIPWHTGGTLHPAGLLRVEARRLLVELLIDDLYKYYRLAAGELEVWNPIVKDPNNYDELVEFLAVNRDGPVACDVETDDIDAMTCNQQIIGIAAKNKKTGEIEGWPIPYHPNLPGFYTEKQWQIIDGLLTQMFFDPHTDLVFHNMAYDVPVLENHFEFDVEAQCQDTLLLHHAVYPKLPHKLQEVASQLLCVEPWKSQFRSSEKDREKIVQALDEATSRGNVIHLDFASGSVLADENEVDEDNDHHKVIRNMQELEDIEIGELLYYNGCDCVATLEVYNRLVQQAHELNTFKVYEEDRWLVRRTIHWYYAGVAIDEELRARLEVEFAEDLDKLLIDIRALCELTPVSEVDEAVAVEQAELDKLTDEYRDIRLLCPFECDYEAKSGPDQCRHIVKEHFDMAQAIASEQKVKYSHLRNPVEQNAVLVEAVKAWHKADLDVVKDQMKAIRATIATLKKTPCIETFNPASPIQLREALRRRGLTPTKLTKKTNELSTAKDSLWDLRDDPFVEILFKYRTKAKLYSTYIVGLPAKLGPDGRLHPVWKIHATPSGRFGTSPAIQNWPDSMQKMIIPDKGHVIVGADYAALELRISALLAGQEDLIQAFLTNADIHARHAGYFFPSVWPQVDKEWRESADTDQERDIKVPIRDKLRGRGKNVTFGKIYRAGDQTLYEQIRERLTEVKTPEEHRKLKQEVAAMSAALDNAYPNIPEWAESMAILAEETNCLRTAISGRIRKWPMGEVVPTEAANHPIQGLAADIMNQATRRLIERLEKEGLYRNGAWIIMQIHDAIYLEVEEQYAVQVAHIVEECLQTELTLQSIVTGLEHRMAFPAEAEIGYNAKELMKKEKWENGYKQQNRAAS
jgi:uracil-DNA glycosylase family 4